MDVGWGEQSRNARKNQPRPAHNIEFWVASKVVDGEQRLTALVAVKGFHLLQSRASLFLLYIHKVGWGNSFDHPVSRESQWIAWYGQPLSNWLYGKVNVFFAFLSVPPQHEYTRQRDLQAITA